MKLSVRSSTGLGSVQSEANYLEFSLTRIVENGSVIESLRREAEAREMPTFTKESWVRGMVTRDGKWDNPLTGDRRRSNARRRRGLEKDFGGEVSVVDRTHDPEAMADFLRLEASGWKGRGDGTAYPRDPAKVAWFRDWCQWWTSAGRVIVIAVNVGETSIAMLYCLRVGREYSSTGRPTTMPIPSTDRAHCSWRPSWTSS